MRRSMGLMGVVGLAGRLGIALALLAGNQPATPSTMAASRGATTIATARPSDGGGSGSSGEYGTAGASARPRLSAAADRECSDFASQAGAQSFFLKKGGPALDASALDPDNDGLACEESPAPLKGLLSIDFVSGELRGSLTSLSADCVIDRVVSVFKVRKGKDKKLGTTQAEDDGTNAIATTLAKGKFYAKAKALGQCAAERSPTIKVPLGRFEIAPAGAFFTAASQSRQLSVLAFDAAENPLLAPPSVFWASSDPSVVAVDRSGMAHSVVGNGSAQITAVVNGVVSAPVLAVVTPLASDAVALTDANVSEDPVEIDPFADPDFDNRVRVVLKNLPGPPAIGTLYINTGTKPVMGRVQSFLNFGGGFYQVELVQVGLDEAFPGLDIDEVMDLAHAPVDINPDIADDYDVARRGTSFTFAPKPPTTEAGEFGTAAASGTAALPPFTECEKEISPDPGSGLPLTPSTPPVFSVTVNPTLEIRHTPDGGLQRFVVNAEPTITAEIGLTLTAAIEGKMGCKVELFVFRAPVPPPIGLIVTGLIPVGVGFELSGKLTIVDVGVGAKLESKGTAQAGFVCASGSCGFVRSWDQPAPKLEPKFNAPSLGDLRFEPAVTVFGYLEAEIGNRFFRSLRLKAFKAQAGVKLGGSFASKTSQITAPDYKSDYKLSLEFSAGLSDKLSDVANALGLSSITGAALSISTDLATSPTGTLTADRETFQTGDVVEFKGHLQATDFLGIGNVDDVLLVRDSGGSVQTVGSQSGRRGRTDFTFNLTATGPGSTSEFYLFLITSLLPFDVFSLELARATAPLSGSVVIDGEPTVSALSEVVAQGYTSVQPRVRVTTGASGDHGGFAKFCAGEIDVVAAARPIKASEATNCTNAGISPVQLKVARDAIAVVINSNNEFADCLSVAQLDNIWSPGSSIDRWNEVDPGFEDTTISLYGPGSDSGTFDYFTEHIVGAAGSIRSDYAASSSPLTIIQGVGATTGGLGFTEYAFTVNQANVKTAGVGAGCVKPTDTTIANGTYSPLTRPLFLYTSSQALNQPQVASFMTYYLDNVSNIAASETGWVEVSPEDLQASKQALQQAIAAP